MSDDVIQLYDDLAREWDNDRGRSLFERAWLERFAALLPEDGSVLDMGCGAGEPIGRWLVEQSFAVTGVDSSPALLEMARKRLPQAEWRLGDMRTLNPGRQFDGVIAWDSFFHLTPAAQRAMFPRFRALSRPGGALMFTSGTEAGEVMGEYRGRSLYHASLDADEYRALLNANGFEVVAFHPRDMECGGHTIWLARLTERQ